MIVAILAFLGGALTILSPCILPVLPFVLARTDQPFTRSTLPLLLGMAATFAAISTLAAVGGAWAVHLSDYGRIAALVLLTLSALALLSRRFSEWITRPFVRLGDRLSSGSAGGRERGVVASLLLGVATGFLWAPCAGPILGLILTSAALRGPSSTTTVLLLAYALGAACSLAVAALASARIIAAMKRSFAAGEWVRRALGVAVLLAVAAIALGWDTGALTRLSVGSTNHFEQALIDRIAPRRAGNTAMQGTMSGNAMTASASAADLPVDGQLPDLSGATAWLNSPPLTPAALRGKVVLVDFWTYSCINCLRALPYVRAWAEKYKDAGLVVLGVHTPEFAFEKDEANVRKAVAELKVAYPVALDNDYKIWKAFNNSFWPADYLVDATGKIRHHHFGEGKYDETEQQIQLLLKERDGSLSTNGLVNITATGTEAPPDSDVQSPETYIGYDRADSFLSPGGAVQNMPHVYSVPKHLELNQWGLFGKWTDSAQVATLDAAPGGITFRFHARDLHLVLGPTADGKPVRFRVKIDGKAPGENHGVDTDAEGNGKVTEHRLYQLIRQKDPIDDRTFEIEFLDPGVQSFSYTFG